MAESADYDPPGVNSGLDFCRNELIDAGYRAQHAGLVFPSFKVEALDVKPASAEAHPITRVLGDELGCISRKRQWSHVYHAGIIMPMFAVTAMEGLDDGQSA